MNPHERLLACLRQEAIDRMPAACPLQTGTLDLMRLTGASWPQAHFDSAQMAHLSAGASTYAGFESARIPFDVVVDAEALGANLGGANEHTAPFVMVPRIIEKGDIGALDVSSPETRGRVPMLLDAIRRLKRLVPDVPVICAHHAPFTLAAQLRGEERSMMDIATDPDFFLRLIEVTTRWSVELNGVLTDAGAEVITVMDAEANNFILGPREFERFALPGEKAVAKAIARKGACSVLHICSDIGLTTEMMVSTGVNALSIGQGTSIRETRAKVRDRCAIIGNVNPGTTLAEGTPAEVAADTLRCIHEGVDIAAPGCGFSPRTPLVNMIAMTSSILSHGLV
ncbi:MAG: MtaA/CmuA family methyltransferase [Methanomassiliicoccales archaeon]